MKSHLEAIIDILSLLSARDKKLLKQVYNLKNSHNLIFVPNAMDYIEKWWEKPPDALCRYSEADLQSGVSIMRVESREIEHCDMVFVGISF